MSTSIDRILNQLLDHGSRALDHLASGDAVDDMFWQADDGHGETGPGRAEG